MIYKFKSAATGDVMLLGPQGDELLRLLGREPAAQGIIEVAAMPAAIAALQAATATATATAAPPDAGQAQDAKPNEDTPVGLRQRVWPMLEMLRRAHAAGQPVVWGV